MKKNHILFFLIILLCITNIHARTIKLNADSAADMALENNLNLKSQGITVEQKRRSNATAWNEFIPDIGLSGGISNSGTFFADPEPSPLNPYDDPKKRTWIVSAGAEMSLRLNAGINTGIKQTKIDYEAGLLSYEDARKKMRRDIRKQYYSIIAMAANLELGASDISLAEKRYEQARENYNNGLISELEMLTAQVSVENSKPLYNIQKTNYQNMIMNFKFMLGVPGNTEIIFTEGLEDITFYSLDSQALINSHVAGRMDVRQIEKQIESLINRKKVLFQSSRTPWLTLFVNWNTDVLEGFEEENWKKEVWKDSSVFGINLTIPLDDWIPVSNTGITLKDMDDQVRQLQLQKQQIIDSAGIQISNLVQILQNSIDTLDSYAMNVKLAEKSFDLTSEAYHLGTRELLDVETAQSELMSASQNVLQERTNYLTTLLELEYAINADDISEILEEK